MTLPSFVGFMLLQPLVICAIFIALCDLCKRLFDLDDLLLFCAAIFALGVLGYSAFWLAFASYAVFSKIKIALLAALLIYFGLIVYLRRLRDYRTLVEPLMFTFLFYLVIISVGFSNGGLNEPVLTARARFSHLLPEDNILPLHVAIGLHDGHIPSPLVGDWLASDRPPLQTGLYLLLTLHNGILPYLAVTIFLQATYLFGVWGLAIAAKLPTEARRLVLLASCLLPTAIINTFFTWPKMLPVGYLLLVFVLLFCRKAENERDRSVIGALIGGLAALSVLAHGSSAFILVGFAIVVLALWAWPPIKTMIFGAASLVALYTPWVIYQNYVDPPGNRLLKWHLAGVKDVDIRPFLATLRDSYGALSWHDYLQGRWVNFGTLTEYWPYNISQITSTLVTQDGNQAAAARNNDFFFLLPSLHYFSLALICALALLPFMPSEQRQQHAITVRLFAAIVATCAAFAILVFIPGQTINHVGSYATQVMIAVLAFTVLSVRAPALAMIFILLQAASVATLYAFTLPHDLAFWPMQLIALTAATAIVAYSFHPRFTPGTEHGT